MENYWLTAMAFFNHEIKNRRLAAIKKDLNLFRNVCNQLKAVLWMIILI